MVQPAPAPRYSVTATTAPVPPPRAGADTDALLGEAGYDADAIAALKAEGVVKG
jgi:alpha-methylacyl-CoA racemase